MEYESIYQEIGPLPNTTNGYCEETIIINCTDDPIGVIDKSGNKILIQPEPGKHNGTIKIYVKKGTGNVSFETHKIKSNPGHIVNVNYRSIITEPVYVKEADILLCYYKNIDLYSHPNVSMSYKESVERLFEELSKIDSIKVPTLKIMANSSNNDIKNLYVFIFGVICEIEITNYNTSDNGVTFIYPNDKTKNLFIPFDEIIKSNGCIKTKYFNCFIGTNREIIKQALEKELNNSLKYTEEEILKIKEDLKKQMESSVKDMKNSFKEKYDADILSKLNRIAQLENELNSAKMEIENLRKLVSSADSFLNYTQKSMNHQTESLKQETERIKILLSFVKVAIPIFIAWGVGKYT